MILALILTLIVLGLTLYLIKWKKMLALSSKFPGPQPVPFLGTLLEYDKDPYNIFEKFMSWNKIYGKSVAVHSVGLDWDLLVTNPKDVETILVKGKTAKKSRVYRFFTQWLGELKFLLNDFQFII